MWLQNKYADTFYSWKTQWLIKYNLNFSVRDYTYQMITNNKYKYMMVTMDDIDDF